MALTDEQLEIISDALIPLFQYLESQVIIDVANRIKNSLAYTRSAELKVESMKRMGYNPAKIRTEALKVLNADPEFRKMVAENTLEHKKKVKEILQSIMQSAQAEKDDILSKAADLSYFDDLGVWNEAGKTLTDSSFLAQLVEAMRQQTSDTFKNLSGTTGFKTMSGFEAMEDLYRRELDKAMIKVCTGTYTREQVVYDVVHSLASSGLRTIDFSSGRSMQLDTAVKLAMRTGAHQLSGKIMDKNIEQTGENLVRVSTHWGARNTESGHANHEQWQGKVYFIKEGIDYSKEAKRIGQDGITSLWHATGYSADGSRENDPLGLYGYNCRHKHYVWFEGISEMSDEDPEPVPVMIDGKKYDYYAISQRQRSKERAIRALKREREAMKALDMDTTAVSKRIRQKTREYNEFCDVAKVKPDINRLRYESGTSDLKKTKAWKEHETIVNMAKRGIIKEETLSRARKIKTEEDLLNLSSSKVIGMGSVEEIKAHFETVHGIRVEGFEGKDLFDVKTTFAGYDDMLVEFPAARQKIKSIRYNGALRHCGRINTIGASEVGPSGLRDYGTGVHEAAHAYDLTMSKIGTHSFAEDVVEQARKNLKLRKNSKEYKALLVQITGLYSDIDKAYEVFAYAMETAKGGIDNLFANEVYRIVGGKK